MSPKIPNIPDIPKIPDVAKIIERLRAKRPRRPIENYKPAWLGATCIAIVAAIAVATLAISSLHIGDVKYRAEFAQAAQIKPGDPVTIAGVEVGTVDGVRLAGDRVIVALMIDRDVALGADTTAAIKLTTLLGRRYIDLKPAGGDGLPDHVIALSHTEVPYDLQQLLADATTTFEQVDAEKIAQATTVLSRQLAGTPAVFPQAVQNIKALSTVIAQRRNQIGTLLNSTSEVTQVLRDQQASLGQLVTQGRSLLNELIVQGEVVRRLLRATAQLATQLKAVAVDNRQDVEELLTNLNILMAMLTRHDDLLRNILQILPVPVRNLTNATGTSNSLDATAPAGFFIDSWMCAISGRAQQFNLPEYFKDCQ